MGADPVVFSVRAPRRWRNWAGNQRCSPSSITHPRDEAEILAVLRQADAEGRTVRPVGSGHSWSGLVPTDGMLLSLDRCAEVLAVDRDRSRITVQGGMRLRSLHARLAREGLALANTGSIDRQTIAGVVSTATHGTGRRFGSLAAQVLGLRLVTVGGDVLECSADKNRDLFDAVRSGLGVLGVISTITLRVEQAYRLSAVEEKLPLSTVLGDLGTMVDSHDHFKFWWPPHTDQCLVFLQDRTDRPARRRPLRTLVDQYLAKNLLADWGMSLSGRWPGTVPGFNRTFLLGLAPQRATYVDRSDRVLSFPVHVRHWESEQAVPLEASAVAIDRLREFLERERIPVNMPVEVRFAAAEDAWLSPAH
ncbi:MAG: D-arabinono-1,4-lactone oxidase, partial [Anaerolineales bacterium]